jgi:cytochrome c556
MRMIFKSSQLKATVRGRHRNTAWSLGAILAMVVASGATHAAGPPDPNAGAAIMQKQMAQMTPELQAKAKELSPEVKQFLAKIAVKHTRHSDRATLVQVMQEILADYQSIAAAIAVDNGELAAESARRLANHPLPRGGMLPYLPLDKVNSKDLSALPGMEETVEGGATRLAEAAERGDMAEAATHLSRIMSGCVGCHQVFRGTPGTSPRLKPVATAR